MFENPAISLYRMWREVYRFHTERSVIEARKASTERPKQTSIEDWSLGKYSWAKGTRHVPLNYRLFVSMSGLTDRHLETGLAPATAQECEPILTLNVTSNYTRAVVPLMSVWPNGDFILDRVPYSWYQVFPHWTFIKTGYAAGKRIWFLPREQDMTRPMWEHLDPTDFRTHRPYVPRDVFVTGGAYRLEMNGTGEYVFVAQGYPANQSASQLTAAQKLAEGYASVERRYERFRRASEKTLPPSQRHKLAVYIPKQGRVTGLEAVDEFTKHLRVYPAPTPEEAKDGNDDLVTGPIHC